MKTKKKKKHTIERKMQISKVDETYCVLRYNIWQIEHTSKSTSFGKQYIKEDQQESQINQQPLETCTPKSLNRKGK
jgi:hypothetical protein